jgi:hypothetical protein
LAEHEDEAAIILGRKRRRTHYLRIGGAGLGRA